MILPKKNHDLRDVIVIWAFAIAAAIGLFLFIESSIDANTNRAHAAVSDLPSMTCPELSDYIARDKDLLDAKPELATSGEGQRYEEALAAYNAQSCGGDSSTVATLPTTTVSDDSTATSTPTAAAASAPVATAPKAPAKATCGN